MIAERLRNWWTGLGRRERIMVVVAASVVLLGLLYSVGVEPAWTTRARLAAELPRLQAELVQLQALRAEAQRLGGRDSAGQSVESLRTALEQSVLRANLAAAVRAEDANTVSVSADNVPAHAWFAWLEAFTRETRSVVMAAAARRADDPGRINASVSFRADARQ